MHADVTSSKSFRLQTIRREKPSMNLPEQDDEAGIQSEPLRMSSTARRRPSPRRPTIGWTGFSSTSPHGIEDLSLRHRPQPAPLKPANRRLTRLRLQPPRSGCSLRSSGPRWRLLLRNRAVPGRGPDHSRATSSSAPMTRCTRELTKVAPPQCIAVQGQP